MADNTTLNVGTGGDTLRTDDIGGSVKVPVSKIMLGGDGLDLGFVSGNNPFPTLTMSGSVGGLLIGGVAAGFANPVPVSGAVGMLIGGQPINTNNTVPVSGSIGIVTLGAQVSVANRLPVVGMETTGQMLSGSTTSPVYLASAAGTSGSNPMLGPLPSNAKIRVLSATVLNNTSNGTFLRWISNAAFVGGYIPLAVSGGFVWPHNPHGWFETGPGEALSASLGFGTSGAAIFISWTKA